MDFLYPVGYGTRLVNLAELKSIHEPRMHPEFAFDLFKWLEHKEGLIGIGGGWRITPHPVSQASMRGESFHQTQTFKSGFKGYAAVDLVAKNENRIHRSPVWSESDDAPDFGLHTFITDEPWHIQSVNMRGYVSWINAGRPDPVSKMKLELGEDLRVLSEPERKYDSRYYDDQLKQPANKLLTLNLNESGKAAFVNVTVHQPESNGYLSVWGNAAAVETSNVNFKAGETVANTAWVPMTNGTIKIVCTANAHLIVDLQAVQE